MLPVNPRGIAGCVVRHHGQERPGLSGRRCPRLVAALATTAVSLLAAPAWAGASLAITPSTWNVIGLDSNNPDAGPNRFPVGARVCNTGDAAATGLAGSFVWETTSAYLKLRPGTLATLNIATLAAGACADFYYEVEVTRDPAAYGSIARYYIEVASTLPGGAPLRTPRPRELYVERLISQSRNSVTDLLVGTSPSTLSSVPEGSTMTLQVGNEYYIRLVGETATQGYEQAEAFVNLPNTVFQVLSVDTTYSADAPPRVTSPTKTPYGDGCLWDNDPNSPNYRSCLDSGKVGGSISVSYHIKILAVGSANPEAISTLIYDFSGSSFHYNSDYTVTTRYAYVLAPSAIGISKQFTADAVTPGSTSTLTFRITNPGTLPLTGVGFADVLPTSPGAMVLTATAPTTSGCGTPSLTATAGTSSILFSNGTVPPLGICVVRVEVSVPPVTVGTYHNASGNLFINGTVDTGNHAAADLLVDNVVVGCSGNTVLASWTVPASPLSTNPPDNGAAGGLPTTKAGNVVTATLAASVPASTAILTTSGVGDNTSWSTYGYKTTTTPQLLDLTIDTRNYSGVSLSFSIENLSDSNGPADLLIQYDKGDGLGFQDITPSLGRPAKLWTQYTVDLTGKTSRTNNTIIRFKATGAKNDNSGAALNYDNITVSGCSYAPPPRLSAAFATDPIALNGGISRLTFTLANDATGVYPAKPLTGVTFTDNLPAGLAVAATPNATTTCAGAALTITADPGSQLIRLTNATMAPDSTCAVAVSVVGTAAGTFENVTGYIDANECDPNRTAQGYGVDTLTVVAPPRLALAVAPTPIYVGDTTTLTFGITNPNQATALGGIAIDFAVWPAGLEVATATTSACGGSLTTVAPATVSFSGGSLAALASCTFDVTASGTTAGSKVVTTSAISSSNGGSPSGSVSATVVVKAVTPAIKLLKQVGLTATAAGPWSSFKAVSAGTSVYYKLTIENTGDVPVDTVSLDDPALPLTCTWPNPLPVASVANDDHIATCISAAVSAVAGSHENTATAHASYGGTSIPDSVGKATYATVSLSLAKSAAEPSFTAAGDVLHYTYALDNAGAAALVGPVAVADDKTTVTCPDLVSVGDHDSYFDAGESLDCTATYTVSAADVTAALVTNRAAASVSGFSSNQATKTVPLGACGDDVLQSSEGCDDGNTNDADGCSYPGCLVRNGGICNSTFPGLTGDASCQSGFCDPGSDTCACDEDRDCSGGQLCLLSVSPHACVDPGCGNGILEAGEGCDDGNTIDADGCSYPGCLVRNGGACNSTFPGLTGGASCVSSFCDGGICACDDDGDCAGNAVCRLSDSPHACVAAGCGNGVLEADEGCDDGNTSDTDGCGYPGCKVKNGGACNTTAPGLTDNDSCASGFCDAGSCACDEDRDCASGEVCKLAATPNACVAAGCGNGVLEASEGCDDGNTDDTDGCSYPGCKVKNGGTCNTTAPGLTGNDSCASGFCDGGTCACDANGDCALGEVCRLSASPNVCVTSGCGNDVLEDGEGCDDGNTADTDGCSYPGCKVKNGGACNTTAPGLTGNDSCASGFCDDGTCACDRDGDCTGGEVCQLSATPNACVAAGCGNDVLEAGEGCDDGNTNDGDGCSYPGCKVRNGGACNATFPGLTGDNSCLSDFCDGGTCACDGDGDCTGGDVCQLSATPNACVAAGCGNDVLEASEGCDDGNTVDSDGCSYPGCKVKNGGACNTTAPGLTGNDSCASGFCDGTVCACDDNGDCASPEPICDTGTGLCVECVSDGECDGATPWCDPSARRCVACLADAHCPGQVCDETVHACVECVVDVDCPGGRCDTTTSTCGPACEADDDCGAPTPVCDTNVGACVECLVNGDCASAVCNTDTNACVHPCIASSDCAAPTPVCDASVGACVQCLGDSDCVSTVNAVCDPTRSVCVECLNAGDCQAGEACGAGSKSCVPTGCLSSADCAEPAPVCNTTTGVCVDCLGNGDCASPAPVCDTSREACVECLSDGDCGGSNPLCDLSAHACVACLTDSDCAGEVCHPTASTCVECLSDNDCAPGHCALATLTCEPECSSHSDCAAPTPLCLASTGACVACLGDSDCPNGLCDGAAHVCVGVDSDGDGVADADDLDDDNDGIPDLQEGDGAVDTDHDGVPDSLDLDADDDGIPDAVEAGHRLGDANGDALVDCPSGFGDNGLCDDLETAPDSAALDYDGDGAADGAVRDTDGDGLPDYRDLDADDDGITDLVEGGAGCVDADANGICDGADGDGDGIRDSADGAALAFGDDGGLPPPDSDGDGVADFRDLDSDNDGLSDLVEGGSYCDDADNDGVCDGADDDGDGIRASADGDPAAYGDHEATTPPDPDGDGAPDYRDTDADGDGLPDIQEAGGGSLDANGDGRIDDATDRDGDGIADAVDSAPGEFGGIGYTASDTDGDGTPDYLDKNSETWGVRGGGLFTGCAGIPGSGATNMLVAAALWLRLWRRRRSASLSGSADAGEKGAAR